MSSTDTSSDAKDSGAASSAGNAAPAVTVTPNAATITPPDTGRPVPPDVIAGDSPHRPGMAPGAAILPGPATMRVGAHREKTSGKPKGGSGRKTSS